MSAERLTLMHDGAAVATVDVAQNAWTRGKGLLGRGSLEPGEGILIKPCSSVHTWFMRFAIDVVYVTDDLEVVKVVPSLRPWRFSFGGRGARHVIELAAGECERLGLQPGDRLEPAAVPAMEGRS